MRFKWLNRNNNNNLIVFFNGWGMDENTVSSLCFGSYDVLAFCDYENFNIEPFDFSAYEKKYLTAWSMGVYVCNYFYEQFKNFDSYTAINGTQKPIDDVYGIPEKIYDLTVNNFNENSCKKFMSKISSAVNLEEYCSRSLEELKSELISIKNLKVQNYFVFNRAIISLSDRIIPVKNQINWWRSQEVPYEEINSSHYIFDSCKNWSDLIC